VAQDDYFKYVAEGCFVNETIIYGVMMETYADAGYTDNTRTYGFRDSTFYTDPPVFRKINDVRVWGCGNLFVLKKIFPLAEFWIFVIGENKK